MLSTSNNSQSKQSPEQHTPAYSEGPNEKEINSREDLRARLQHIVDIVAQESGVSHVDLKDETDFMSVGVDSLLALLITSRLKEDLGFDVGSGLSIFDEFRTLGQLKEGYLKTNDHMAETWSEFSSSKQHSASMALSFDNSILESVSELGIGPEEAAVRSVTSIVLQQAEDRTDKSSMLFLFPDGSGSALSYASLPTISPHMTLIGLFCPYRREPQAMNKCSLDVLLSSYITEIRRRQPYGPYSLGGWSSGGVFAFRAAQMLIDSGEVVRDLLLIDSPPPLHGLEKLPERFYEHCSKVGVFGQIEGDQTETEKREQPEWLVPHFNATVDLLSSYHARPLTTTSINAKEQGCLLHIVILWAGRSALDGEGYPRFELLPEDGEGVRFLAEPREDFGLSGWAQLLPETGLQIHVLKKFDHFGMMVSFAIP